MSWSISLGRIAGTEVRIHLTFFLLLAWFGVAAGMRGGQAEAIDAVVFVLAVFACVLAHEYGHVLTARRFGIGTRDITLLPIGGVASIERMPENPRQELLIALAGPAVNVVIAAVLFAFFGADISSQRLAAIEDQRIDFVTRLALINVMLVLFNLLPAFPMDGGRVLRALLSMWVDRVRATQIAAAIGQAIAFGLGFLGLFGNPLLIFIALFVFIAATHEAQQVELGEAVKGTPLTQATITSFATLDTQATVADAAKKLLATTQGEFPVTDGAGRARGVLTRDGIIKALSETGPDTPVLDVMMRDFDTISARAPLSEAVSRLQSKGLGLVCVIDEAERVVGIITMENLAEFMLVNQAWRGWSRAHGRATSTS
jgi:Zn-dependent protease/CBS domain-containing protein